MPHIKNELSNIARRSPGYLLAPFSWAAEPIAAVLEADPSLYPSLFTLTRERMHLIALALAHRHDEMDAPLAWLIIEGATSQVFDAVLGRRPVGLKRALAHLPHTVMPPDAYRSLIELLADRASAKLIHHAEMLDESIIKVMFDVPKPLRRLLSPAGPDYFLMEGLTDGLRILAARGAASSFDTLVADLARTTEAAQFLARIREMARTLPLPDFVPPPKIGAANRLDSVAQICRLAKRWKNCMTMHIQSVNDGKEALYLWPHETAPAACQVVRYGRLGWFLEQVKGPNNANLPPDRLEEIQTVFAAAGMPPSSTISAIERIVDAPQIEQIMAAEEARLARPRRRQQAEMALEEILADAA